MNNPKEKIDTAIVTFVDILGYAEVVKHHINNIELIHSIKGIAKTALSLIYKCAESKEIDYHDYMQKIVKTIDIKMISDSILFVLNFSRIEPDFRVNRNENLTCHLWTYFVGISAFCLTSDSDLDMFIISKKRDEALKAIVNFKANTVFEIKPVIKKQVEWMQLEKSDPEFFGEVNQGIILWEKPINESGF